MCLPPFSPVGKGGTASTVRLNGTVGINHKLTTRKRAVRSERYVGIIP
jgi:hypothetical protein